MGKESACNAGDPGSISGSGRSPREGTGCPLQYSCLDESMDRRVWQTTVYRIAKGQTWLKWLSTHAHMHGGPTVCSRTKNLWMHAKWWAQPQRRASVGLLTQQSERGSPWVEHCLPVPQWSREITELEVRNLGWSELSDLAPSVSIKQGIFKLCFLKVRDPAGIIQQFMGKRFLQLLEV